MLTKIASTQVILMLCTLCIYVIQGADLSHKTRTLFERLIALQLGLLALAVLARIWS